MSSVSGFLVFGYAVEKVGKCFVQTSQSILQDLRVDASELRLARLEGGEVVLLLTLTLPSAKAGGFFLLLRDLPRNGVLQPLRARFG